MLDNGAHLTDEFSVQGVCGANLKGGIPTFRFLDENRRDQTWRSLLCGSGPCDARQFAGARRSISVDFEELDPRDNRRSNLDLCIAAPGKKRKDCAKLQLDLALEELKTLNRKLGAIEPWGLNPSWEVYCWERQTVISGDDDDDEADVELPGSRDGSYLSRLGIPVAVTSPPG